MTRLVTIADNYPDIYSAFQWNLPKQYNIAWDVCDRHAGDPSKIALIHHLPDQIRKYTFREIQLLANRLANTFVAHGLLQGDRVLILLGQHPVTAFSHVACWKAGLISVPTSTLFGVDGLDYRLNNSGASALITDSINLPKALEAQRNAPALQHIFVIDGPAVDGALPLMQTIERASSEFKTLALTPDTPAFINYTSGTTGWPKGTLQGHRSMIGHMPGVEVLFDLYPVLVLRNRVREEKEKELKNVFQSLGSDSANFGSLKLSATPQHKSDLLTHLMFVESRWEWPIASHVTKLVLWGLLVPLTWVLSATIENVLY